jgi:molecular chaperone GrpE
MPKCRIRANGKLFDNKTGDIKEQLNMEEVKNNNTEEVENQAEQQESAVIEEPVVNEQVQQESELENLQAKLAEAQDKYLRLSAEFDNYRRRTLKEKADLMKTAGEDVLINVIPVLDDFERAMQSLDTAKDPEAIKEGITLIYTKFKDFLQSRGVKEIPAAQEKFDTEYHEAITKIPAPNKKLKGKVVDVIQKGYFLHEKVVRYAKVVVGE